MQLHQVTESILNPALAWLPSHMDRAEARVMMLATGLQESRFIYREQLGNGPAHSFWQFEKGTQASRGGIWGIYLHPASKDLLRAACALRGVTFEPVFIWQAITTDDVLAAICARLLLWTDAQKLPAVTDSQGAWELYAERTWRPGKPHRDTWDAFHAQAVAEVVG